MERRTGRFSPLFKNPRRVNSPLIAVKLPLDMKKLRQIHLYLGVLFAPSILFFAFTGAYQTFRWQENGALGALSPIASQMASIHKNSALEPEPEPEREAESETKPRREAPSAALPRRQSRADADDGDEESPRRGPSPLPLKIYVFLMSLGLITSTGTGVALAFKYNRSRRLIWGLLIVGTVLPLALLFV